MNADLARCDAGARLDFRLGRIPVAPFAGRASGHVAGWRAWPILLGQAPQDVVQGALAQGQWPVVALHGKPQHPAGNKGNPDCVGRAGLCHRACGLVGRKAEARKLAAIRPWVRLALMAQDLAALATAGQQTAMKRQGLYTLAPMLSAAAKYVPWRGKLGAGEGRVNVWGCRSADVA